MSDEEEYEAEAEPKEMSEAEAAMAAAKKKHDGDESAKLAEYEEQRQIQREKEEEELRLLKEKQERRKQEREEEERQMAERRAEEEERRKAEEDERKAKLEEEKKKKDEKKKKAQGLAFTAGGGPNFVVPKKAEGGDKFGNIVQAKAEMGLTKDQVEEKKKQHIEDISSKMDCSGLDASTLRQRIKDMHQQICRLEAENYDLETRHSRQEYDLKELNERQRQISRNKALKKGMDPDEATSSRHPPKVSVASKYDRQTDRRNFGERKRMFEVKNAIPHFPNCPPPEVPMEKVIASGGEGGEGAEGEGGEEEEEEDEEEEEE